MKTLKSPQGFSLVELLVILAVLGILAAILFPVVSSAVASSRSSRCMSNLRQLGSGVQLYANDHNGLFPANGGSKESPQLWGQRIAPYVGIDFLGPVNQGKLPPDPFSCPEEHDMTMTGSHRSHYSKNIELNGSPSGTVKVTQIPYPEKTFLLADSLGRDMSYLYEKSFAPRHDGKANVIFVDMHVESLDPAKINRKYRELPLYPFEDIN